MNQFLQLTFRSHQNGFSLNLLFDVRDPTPFINPPASFAEWGRSSKGHMIATISRRLRSKEC